MRFAVFALVLTVSTAVYGQSGPSNGNLEGILNALSQSASSESYREIADAINSSNLLRSEMNKAAATNILRGIVVADKNEIHDGRITVFGGLVSEHRIMMTNEFLTALQNNRLSHTVYPDDISPNNTIFALAHLLYHLNNPLDMKKFVNPGQYATAATEHKAAAFIYGWNIMLNAAEQSNNNKTLSPRQVGQLLMNFRYRAAFFAGINYKLAPLHFEDSGEITPNSNNIDAIAATLGQSKLYDIE